MKILKFGLLLMRKISGGRGPRNIQFLIKILIFKVFPQENVNDKEVTNLCKLNRNHTSILSTHPTLPH